MLLLAVLFLVAPAIPSPPADSLAAAVALWAQHPSKVGEKDLALKMAIAEAADEALTRAGAGRGSGGNKRAAVRYADTMKQLEARLLARVPQDIAELDRQIDSCAANGVARALAPAEIIQVRNFMATALGRRFWDAAGLSLWPLRSCYRAVLDLAITDEDYGAIGVRSGSR